LKLNVEASYLGCSQFTSDKTKKTYHKANFMDKDGGQLELETGDMKVVLPQFHKCNIVVDVVQGKYSRYILMSYDPIK
jgi:hypothetical protein